MKQIITRLTDDLDGESAAETHVLELDGRAVEIDLSEGNADLLYDMLDRFFTAGRRIAGGHRAIRSKARDRANQRAQRPVTQVAPAGATQTVIRGWWKSHPEDLPTWQARGRLPAAVMRAWEELSRIAEE